MEKFTREYVEMWQRWSDFEGRSDIRDYWMAVLVNFIISLLLTLIGRAIGFFNTINALYGLAVLIPGIALFIRRMHDIGKSGWNILWVFLPIIGWIYLIILLIKPSQSQSE
ncbi:MAG: DUF805 domain-containing protein [Candidatus Izimaplasma sp.]|nr:DUF805 domain-containing protein [Candidatus Izimaplasma bacterium]